ncbi:hypothetical protein [uncultured Paenibacillus sp.]|uniref:hypothetical protein n=1 Tax=uncultured Paenibacillus sp. TaxID=227322 RepID=UPI0015B219BA|nr:hypothetical protein [uncultured Paenibacillus sp.]
MEQDIEELRQQVRELREEVERLKREQGTYSDPFLRKNAGRGGNLGRIALAIFIGFAAVYLVLILIGVIQFVSG